MAEYDRYYSLTKWSLLFLGQWPFRTDTQNRMRRIIIYSVLMSILMPKLCKCFLSLDDADEVILCMPMLLLHILGHVKYYILTMNTKKIKRLIEKVYGDWDVVKSEEDRKILHEHSERGRFLTTAYAIYMFGILISYLLTPWIPKVMDILIPLDEPRQRIFLYETEYFVDQDENYYYILIHAYLTVPVSLAVIVFFDNMFALYINHACGMLGIVSSHLQRLHITSTGNHEESESIRYMKIHNRINYCAELHNNIIEFIELAESAGSVAILVVVGLNGLLITVTGMSTIMKLDKPSEATRDFAFLIGGIFHLFYISSQWNLLVEGSGRIFRDAYESEWYTFHPRLQKLLIPIMMRSKKPCCLTAGGIYVMSMESFSDVLRKAMSFFTVLNSTR